MSSDAPTLYPLMRFTDAPAAMDFLQQAFGFAEHERIVNPDGTIAHAELSLGASILMLGSDRDDPRLGRRAGTGWIYVAVNDADEHCRRARGAGAKIITEPFDTDYGSRDYAALDPEGNQWHFGTYRPAPEPTPADTSAATA
ncbi:MAG: VOC family protein [Solirubrobacteraceae bacterium]